MKYQQLTEGQRYQISLLREDNLSCSEIGIRIGVSKSTVSREVRRNWTAGGYSAAEAQRLSDTRRRVAAKRFISPDTVFYVETGLSWKWSPEQISAVGKRIGVPVSHEWIYQHVQADKAAGGELYKHLRQGKRRYRKGYGQKRGRIPDAVSIEQRPAVVDERGRLGDWEADLVLGKQGTGAIVTLAERKSRIYLIKKVFSRESGEVSNAIISMLSDYKDVCHTITFDNGGEFSEHQSIAEALEAEMYFAHPYAPHERGLNENTNGLLRQFIPKGTDLRTVSEEDLAHYQGALNSRPRKCLEFRQPSVVFAELRMAA
ncbi:IS30 family transposase [Salmonella enterica]|nr:IS30 family transposase [Salmonella enterica subsp. enterica serovar Typhimurium]EEH0276978.1 IS30 family transposase [Salmonella enterica]EIP3426936.1 IS30 family transposase [Salmonella enterica]EJU6229234.1 IS30 family transposase [Salmonella enterica]EKB8061797.1 IS30 family transposase [Salmonella enterica]